MHPRNVVMLCTITWLIIPTNALTWQALDAQLPKAPPPTIIDAVHHRSSPPPLPDDTIVLYRERNGWCPYSERVWLALECKNLPFATVLIDNTGGGRPSWFGSTTPRLRWPDGSDMGESMDIVRAIDDRYGGGPRLYGPPDAQNWWRSRLLPARRRRRRAAFLFRSSGAPVFRAAFEETLEKTDALLEERGGPFFAGADLSAADVAWAPFLERYAAQLPLLHDGLRPRDASKYPSLARCAFDDEIATRGAAIWDDYAATRDYVASTPAREAAAAVVRNRDALVADAARFGIDDAGAACWPSPRRSTRARRSATTPRGGASRPTSTTASACRGTWARRPPRRSARS
ncbi:glutathione S-transferase [Aureococcus anophagefferens]|nr:glutathione S-transferase [Aureococcus anophagefferens]